MFSKCAQVFFCCIFLLCSTTFAENSAYKRGENAFFAYCSGCHSLKYTSYPQLAMPESDALNWFGVLPPDLSLSAKYRGQAWLRAYLRGFYPDKSRPFGCNNYLIPNVQMPNVLFPLKTTENYQQTIDDLIIFLNAISDSNKNERQQLGLYVVSFFLLLALLLWLIYRKNKIT